MLSFLTIQEVSSRVRIGKTKIYSLINEGEFPPPKKIGVLSRWLSSDVDAFIIRVSAAENSK